LEALQRHLTRWVPQPAGLNARAFRQPRAAEGAALRAGAYTRPLSGST